MAGRGCAILLRSLKRRKCYFVSALIVLASILISIVRLQCVVNHGSDPLALSDMILLIGIESSCHRNKIVVDTLAAGEPGNSPRLYSSS